MNVRMMRFAVTVDGRGFPLRELLSGMWEVGRPDGETVVVIHLYASQWRALDSSGEVIAGGHSVKCFGRSSRPTRSGATP